MRVLKASLLLLVTLLGFTSLGQEVVNGVVENSKTGEGIFNATISVNGVKKAKTDFDGSFTLNLKPGDYTIKAEENLAPEEYKPVEVKITVVAGGPNEVKLQLVPTVKQIQQAVVKGTRNPDKTPKTDADADNLRDKQAGSSEVVSKAAISRSGASNALNVVQMTPGASVQDGKDVYIRGLGDRYTKTILNGMEIPGLDPDKNSVQMDIFPAVLIDNITVYKSFTPNLFGDFTGGLINIRTTDFPSKKTIYFKAGLGYNSRATFNSDFIGYEGGKLDWLGFDDGSRGLPISPTAQIPHPALGSEQTHTATSAFGTTMATQQAFSFLNQNYSFAMGNLKKVLTKDKDSTLRFKYGYNVALNYRTQNNYFGDVQYNEYIRAQEFDDNELFRDRSSSGQLATSDVRWTGLIGQSILKGRSKYSLNLFHTQNGTNTAANLREENFESNQAVLVKQGLQFTQRSVSNLNLNARHYLDSARTWKLNWAVAPTYSRITDPDIRSTALEVSEYPGPNGEEVYIFEESVGAEIRRIFRDLVEINVSGRVDLEHKFQMWKKRGDSLESKLTFGGLNTYKSRWFDVNEYVFRLYGMSNEVPNNPDWFFQPENIWSPTTGQGVYATGQQEKANIYDANQNITSAYVMHNLPLTSAFQMTYGARVEKTLNRYTGQSNNADFDPNAPRYINEVVLDELNVLPSLNMVYKIKGLGRKRVEEVTRDGEVFNDTLQFEKKTNFRGSYTQTLARPSFREISISQIYDPIQGRRYLGNIDLKQTLIHNAEVRWEHFFGRTELISASAFYKKFINPIEVVANVAAPNEFMPVNAGEADVYGVEFEIRKAIGFNKPGKRDYLRFIVGANFAYIVSLIDMNEVVTEVGGITMTEKEVREANARDGEVISDYRPMYGQSPFVVNAFMNFQNDSLGLTVNLTYNVQGKKLAVIGVGSLPDVYEQPFHSLNFKASKTIGKDYMDPKTKNSYKRWTVSLKATNLLNNARQRWYEAYQAESQIFDYLNQGMTVTGAISFSL